MITAYDTLPRSVGAHENARAEVIRELVLWLARAWPPGRPMDPDLWFQAHADEYAERVTMAQLEAAVLAEWSVDDALSHQDHRPPGPLPETNFHQFASVDGRGRPVMGQAYASAGMVGGAVEGAVEAGGDQAVALAQAWKAAGESLLVATQTMISDTSRAVKSTRMLAQDTGWVRVLTPPSCSRCAVLAGKFHRSATADFNRHPRCDCTQMPVANRNDPDMAGLFIEPQDYFDSLTASEQDKIFTKSGAQAIRDGADVGQVVNVRRGMATATYGWGYTAKVTTEGTTKKGWATQYLRHSYDTKLRKQPGSRYRRTSRARLMPEQIYKIAGGDRDIAMDLLHKNGYYLDASPSLASDLSFYTRDAELRAARERAMEKLQRRRADR